MRMAAALRTARMKRWEPTPPLLMPGLAGNRNDFSRHQYAPSPRTTTFTVFARIYRSSQIDQFRT